MWACGLVRWLNVQRLTRGQFREPIWWKRKLTPVSWPPHTTTEVTLASPPISVFYLPLGKEII